MSRSRLLVAVCAVFTLLSACGGSSSGPAPLGSPDAGSLPDSGSPPDAGSTPDGGGSPDGGAATHTVTGGIISGDPKVDPTQPMEVDLSGDATATTTTTDSSGHFSFQGLPNGTYTLRLALCASHECNPSSLSVTVKDADVLNLTQYIVGCQAGVETQQSGSCVCPSGVNECVERYNSYCVDMLIDAKNCGGCGVTCDTGSVCSDGVCTPAPSRLSGFGSSVGVSFSAGNLAVSNDRVYSSARVGNWQASIGEIVSAGRDGGLASTDVSAPVVETPFAVDGQALAWAGKQDGGAQVDSVYLQPLDGGAPVELARVTGSGSVFRVYFGGLVMDAQSIYYLEVVTYTDLSCSADIVQVPRSGGAATQLYSEPVPCNSSTSFQNFALTGDATRLYFRDGVVGTDYAIEKADGGATLITSDSKSLGAFQADDANLYLSAANGNQPYITRTPLSGGTGVLLVGNDPNVSPGGSVYVGNGAVYWTGYQVVYGTQYGAYERNGLFKTHVDGGDVIPVLSNSLQITQHLYNGGSIFFSSPDSDGGMSLYRFDRP